MTKILRGILLLAFAACLCGCQNENLPQKSQTESYAYVALSINPELEIHVDPQNQVQKVVCKNADANAVCDGLDCKGLPFADCLQSLLNRCVDLGYLTDGGNLSLTVTGSTSAQQEQLLLQHADTVLQELAADQKIHFSAQLDASNLGATSSDYLASHIPAAAQPEYNAQGVLTGYREVLEDGSVILVAMDAAGNVIQEDITNPVGFRSVFTYDDQGNLTGLLEVSADGTTDETLMDASGKVLQAKHLNADGSGWMFTLNAQGLPLYREEYAPGGAVLLRLTRVYDSANPLHYTETDGNGVSTEGICDANGNDTYTRREDPSQFIFEAWLDPDEGAMLREKITEPDGTTIETVFENGVPVSEVRLQVDGVRMDKQFENGIPTLALWVAPDGEAWQDIYNANGDIEESNGTNPGGGHWTKRYAGGALVYSRIDDADGSFMEDRYEGGRQVYHAAYKVGFENGPSITTSRYNANGTLAFRSSVDGNGSVYEETCDGNGNPISWRMVDASGVETTGTFDANGRPVQS